MVGVLTGAFGGATITRVLSAELEAGAAVKPYGALKWDDRGVFVQFGVDFDGLKGSATIKMAYGFLTKGASWTIVNPRDQVNI